MAQTIKPTSVERKLGDDAFVVSMTDREGRITYANRTFLEISGFSEAELIGKPHRILRDPAMPAALFKRMWDSLKHGDEFVLFIRSLGKDGSHHWGFSTLIPSHDAKGHVIGYYSVRRRAAPGAIDVIAGIYRTMREKELRAPGEAGVKASLAVLNDFLAEKGMSYDQFVHSLQA